MTILRNIKIIKKYGTYQDGIGILISQSINMIFSLRDIHRVGVGLHGMIDGNILKKIQKS